MSSNTLVAYYSMTGNTRRIAEELAAALGADLEEIREPHPRLGAWGTLRAFFDAVLGREPKILAPRNDPKRYRLLVLGGPIWAGHLAAPVRSYARQFASGSQRVALFCTEGGSGADAAFVELQTKMGWAHDATLIIDSRRRAPDAHRQPVQQFLIDLRQAPMGSPTQAMPGAVA